MKKHLLTFIALFIGFVLFGQTTVKLLDNSQYGAPNSFQAKITSIIPADYHAKTGDLITLKIAGTSDYDLTDFQMVFADTREVVSYWSELSGWKSIGEGNVTNGSAFDFSIDVTITKDASGAGGGFINLILDAVSVSAKNASAPEVTLTLTNLEIIIEPAQEGIISLTDNGNGAYQGEFPDTLNTEPVVKIGDIVKVTIEGTSNVDISNFQAIVIDGTAAANYWKELGAFSIFGEDGLVTANTPFSLTAEIEITSVPDGTGFKSQFIVITGVASETIKLNLTKFEAITTTPVPVNSIKLVSPTEIISTSIYTLNGIQLRNIKSIDELNTGIYIQVNKYSDGSVTKTKIFKNNQN